MFVSCCCFILCHLKLRVRARTYCTILQWQITRNVGWQASILLNLFALLIIKCSTCRTVLNNLKWNLTLHENDKQNYPLVTVLFPCKLSNEKLYIYLKVANSFRKLPIRPQTKWCVWWWLCKVFKIELFVRRKRPWVTLCRKSHLYRGELRIVTAETKNPREFPLSLPQLLLWIV